MSIAEVKENIVNLLENIVKRSQIIEKQSGDRNLIEIDLAMDDTRLLYRELDLLRKITETQNVQGVSNQRERITQTSRVIKQVDEVNSPPSNDKPANIEPIEAVKPQPVVKEKPVIAPVVQEVTEVVVPDEKPPIQKIQEKPTIATAPVSEPNPVFSKTPAPEPAAVRSQVPVQPVVPVKEPVAEKKEKSVTLVGEKFAQEKGSIYERLASIRDDKSIGTKMQQKPVGSIKDAIGINEKFLFINELFGGDLNAYNDAVSKLNSCQSIHEAFDLLNKYTVDFNWDGQRSGETIDRFANLVQRRYM